MRRSYQWIAGLSLPLVLLTPLLYSAAKSSFSNMQNVVHCQPSQVIDVHNILDVQNAVRYALDNGLKIKAGIKGWAGSNESSCVDAGGVQINTEHLNAIVSMDAASQQVRVQPGIKLWDFNQETHKRARLILPALQEYADVTLGGMLGNGTHGSSLGQASSSIQDYVLSVTYVDGRGAMQIARGEDLDFLATNLGVLGILTEVTLQLQPSFKVQAETSGHSDQGLADAILDLAQAHYGTSISWFPGQRSYALTAYDRVDDETPGDAHNGQTESSWWKREIFPAIFKAAHLTPDRGLMCLLEQQRYEMKTKSFYTLEFGKNVDPAVGWAHNMLYFVCRDRCPFDDLPYALEEIAIDLDRLPAFIQDAQALFAKNRACLPLNGIYFRFGKATRGALGMASGRDTAYIGMEYVRNSFGDHYPKDFDVVQELEQVLLHRYEGRPHWGKNQKAIFDQVLNKYPRAAEFEAFRKKSDPSDLFLNASYRQISGQEALKAPAKNCVVDSSCYCQTDDHCPRFYRCEKGLIDEQARVCRLSHL